MIVLGAMPQGKGIIYQWVDWLYTNNRREYNLLKRHPTWAMMEAVIEGRIFEKWCPIDALRDAMCRSAKRLPYVQFLAMPSNQWGFYLDKPKLIAHYKRGILQTRYKLNWSTPTICTLSDKRKQLIWQATWLGGRKVLAAFKVQPYPVRDSLPRCELATGLVGDIIALVLRELARNTNIESALLNTPERDQRLTRNRIIKGISHIIDTTKEETCHST